jgi:hypothetical protein
MFYLIIKSWTTEIPTPAAIRPTLTTRTTSTATRTTLTRTTALQQSAVIHTGNSRIVLKNTRLQEPFAIFKTISEEGCFDKCDADPKCAAACLTVPLTCRLFKYGFQQVNSIGGSSSYIKAQVLAELNSQLAVKFPTIKPRTMFLNYYDAFDTITPSLCFATCTASQACAAASFTTGVKYLFNCYMYKSGQYRTSQSAEGIELWTSFTKSSTSGEQRPLPVRTTTTTEEPVSQTVAETVTTSQPTEADEHSSGNGERQHVLANTRLLTYYDELKTQSSGECFDKCDEQTVICAAACFTLPNVCHLAKFSFSKGEQSDDSTAYFKPEVYKELFGSSQLSEKFREVKQSTRLVGTNHDQYDTLTPSDCFGDCLKSEQCAAAVFITDPAFDVNCFVFRAGRFAKGAQVQEMFTSYIKA